MEDLTPSEIILAFARTHDEDKFWPTPGRLRELSGREAQGDPLEREAVAALSVVLSKMRSFGWELKPRPGKIIATDSPDGRLLEEPTREPTQYHGLPRRSMLALATLGWGDHQRGLALLRDHPGLRDPAAGDAEFRVNLLRQADELKRRWVEAYRNAMGGK